MKKIFIALFLCGLTSTIGCSDSHSDSGTETNANLHLRKGSNYLFSFSSEEECAENMAAIAKEQQGELESALGFDEIGYVIDITEGKAYLNELHYIDTAKKLILRSEIFNPGTGNYDLINENVSTNNNPSVPNSGPCPEGFSHLGDCTPNPNDGFAYGQCIGSLTATYQLNHMSSDNAFAMFTNQSTGTTRICAKSGKLK